MSSTGTSFEKVELEFTDFEWNDSKRKTNIDKHGFDFVDVISAFDYPIARKRSDRGNEKRFLAIGVVHDQEIAIAYQERGSACRIISARKARRAERGAYQALLAR